MPVYNASPYLREAVDSILNQTFTDFELLAINDGSTDNSIEILSTYSDVRLRVLSNLKNMGLIATLNRGIDEARGKYIVRQDADDASLPNRLDHLHRFMENHPEVDICGSWYDGIHGNDRKPGVRYLATDNEIRIKHLYQIHISHGTSIWRVDSFKKNNWKFDPDFKHAEDYDLFVRASYTGKLANLTEVLYLVRYHAESVSQKHSQTQAQNSFRVIKGLFEKLGISVSENEIGHFQAMCYHDQQAANPEVLKPLMQKLAKSTKISEYIDKQAFDRWISHQWLHFCYNRGKAQKGMYKLWKSANLSTGLTGRDLLLIAKFHLTSLING